jgi:hypothetical protein
MAADPRAELVALVEKSLRQADDAIDALIRWEIKQSLPELEQREADAAADLRAAVEALKPGQEQLAGIQAELETAEGRAAEYQARITDTQVETRVEAGRWFREWSEEITRLKEKRDQVERDNWPAQQRVNTAKEALATASKEVSDRRFNLRFPRLGFGTMTGAYAFYRQDQGRVIPLLIKGDRADPEWPVSFAWLRTLIESMGWRLVEDDRPMRDMFDSWYNRAHQDVEPAPSGAEVIRGQQLAEEMATANLGGGHEPARPTVGQQGPSRAEYLQEAGPGCEHRRQVGRVNVQIYALVDPSTDAPVYIGSTILDTGKRLQKGYPRNPGVSEWHEWLSRTTPEIRVLDEVQPEHRYVAERAYIRAVAMTNPLLNQIHNGFTRSPEARAKISRSVRAYWQQRRNLPPGTGPGES